jgi:hypothetical protein
MEIAKKELEAIQTVVDQAKVEATDLSQLELAVVGGGCGEVLFG